MMKNFSQRNVLRCALLVFTILIQGCAVNLPAVRDYSKATMLASNSYNVIVDDLPKSCIRRVDISFEGQKVNTAISPVGLSTNYLDAVSTCSEIENSLAGIYEANNILQQYAEALGKLASNETITFTSELNQLEGNLKKVKINEQAIFDNNQAKAVFQLSEYLIRVAIDGYRQKELKETIDTAEPYIPVLVDGLVSIVEDYNLVLEDEKLALLDKRDVLDRKIRKSGDINDKDALNERLYTTITEINAIDSKQKAANDYISVLDNIKTTHSNLAQSSKNELQSPLLINIIQQYVQELIPILSNLKKAFNT